MATERSTGWAFDVQGHRGARGLAPENTLAAFARALELGVTTLELDLAVTKDDVLVVSHDAELNPDLTRDAQGRWLEARGPAIHRLTLAELRAYDVGRLRPGSEYAARFPQQVPVDGQRIPTFDEVVELTRRAGNDRVRFNVETKIDPRFPERTPPPEAFADLVVQAIRRHALTARATIQSFDWRTLRQARQTAPEIETVALTIQTPTEDNLRPAGETGGRPKGGDPRAASPWLAGLSLDDFGGSVPRLVKASGAAVWSPFHGNVTPEAVREAHAFGLRVIPWTVNEPDLMRQLIAAGVDGLITDYPARVPSRGDPPAVPPPATPAASGST